MFSSLSTIGESIFTDLEEILGAPVLLEGEDSGSYYRLRELLRNAVSPSDTIEALWVRDIADLTWEIQRYRRWKSAFHRFAEIDGAEQIYRQIVEERYQEDGFIPDLARQSGDEVAL